jgi:uncharacterized iron-regulated protein
MLERQRSSMWLATAIAHFTASLLLLQPAVAQVPAHPLTGKIFNTRTGALTDLSDPALVPALFPCEAITLLGEVHDNPAHHAARPSGC